MLERHYHTVQVLKTLARRNDVSEQVSGNDVMVQR